MKKDELVQTINTLRDNIATRRALGAYNADAAYLLYLSETIDKLAVYVLRNMPEKKKDA